MAKLPLQLPKDLTDKFQIFNNTLGRDIKSDFKDRITLEVGDSKQPETFYPQAKIMRWDNEVNASFRYVDKEAGNPVIITEGKVIKYIKPKVEFHTYELDPNNLGEDGGLEIELILKEKPDTNKFEFTIQTKELDFFYQPPLTQSEIQTEETVRSENVIGSYAVYHKTKGRMNDAAGMEYKVGKAFHIYRPKVIDADRNETWGELNINEAEGFLIVTIDQNFLDNAIYPVIVDPTFGYTSIGATSGAAGANFAELAEGTPADSATIDKLTFYAADPGGTADVKGALWVFSSLVLVTNSVSNITANISSTAAWRDLTYTTAPSVVGGTQYYLGFISDDTSWTRFWDVVANNGFDANSYASPTNLSLPLSDTDDRHSVYATYSLGGAGAAVIVGSIPSPAVRFTDRVIGY